MTNVDPNPYYLWAGSTSSPVYNMEKNIKQNRMMRLVGNAFVRITPFKDFRVELSASANYYDLDGNDYKYTSTTGSWAQGEGQNSSGGIIRKENGVLFCRLLQIMTMFWQSWN